MRLPSPHPQPQQQQQQQQHSNTNSNNNNPRTGDPHARRRITQHKNPATKDLYRKRSQNTLFSILYFLSCTVFSTLSIQPELLSNGNFEPDQTDKARKCQNQNSPPPGCQSKQGRGKSRYSQHH
ncbi:unnamed protein product [Polarella glacialis]|uniref:Uncharacterized protein n=1 Tax=Polarella glacialis TaxID=89957 RepID=A0A813DX13_POLGL|nr:unnamed protein product [Polarella glacialis]